MLAIAPTPDRGKAPSRSTIAAALRRGGRQRNIESRTIAIQTALRTEQLQAPPVVAEAMGAIVGSLVKVVAQLNVQIEELETTLADRLLGQAPGRARPLRRNTRWWVPATCRLSRP